MRASRRCQRKLDDILIVDVDAHHYENENFDEILPFMENDVLRQVTIAGRRFGRRSIVPSQASASARTWAAASPAIRCARPRRPTRTGMRDVSWASAGWTR